MKNTIKELYSFQKEYLKKIIENIPDDKLFFNQEKEVNSPGWILGHLIVEVEDLFNYLEIKRAPFPEKWELVFRGGSMWTKNSFKALPTKQELIDLFELRYDRLVVAYIELTDEERLRSHPSKMMESFYTNIDAWFGHHLITHLAIHCGNIITWKQINGIEAEGF